MPVFAGGDAAKSFRRSGECYSKVKSEFEASTAYVECARCYIKAGDSKAGTEILETEALPRIVDGGKLSQAAKLHFEVAEMFENDGMTNEAIKHFREAADLHSADNSTSTALKAVERVAFLCTQTDPPEWESATENFERVGTESLNSNLMKFGAKSAFFNAYLCTLARGDVVAAERNLEKYKEQDYTFPGCREAKLADDILAAYKDMNVEVRQRRRWQCGGGGWDGGWAVCRRRSSATARIAFRCANTRVPPCVALSQAFTEAIIQYDTISKLTPWRTRYAETYVRGAGCQSRSSQRDPTVDALPPLPLSAAPFSRSRLP